MAFDMFGKRSSFFKEFYCSNSSETMHIPGGFVEMRRGMIPKSAILKNSHGRTWYIEITRVGRDMFFFAGGWSKFVTDNSLTDHDFMSFDYDGKSTFDFSVIRNGKKVDEAEFVDEMEEVTVEEVEEKEEASMEKEAHKRFEGEEIFKHGLIARPKYPYFVTKLNPKRQTMILPIEVIKCYDIKLPAVMKIVSPDGVELFCEVDTWKDGSLIRKGWTDFTKIHNIKDDDRCLCEFILDRSGENDVHLKMTIVRSGSWLLEGERAETSEKMVKKRKSCQKFEEEEIFKHGLVARPEHPYFITELNQKREIMFFPVGVITNYGIKLPQILKIVCPDGVDLFSDVYTWKDGRSMIRQGWTCFTDRHNIEYGDKCICEFHSRQEWRKRRLLKNNDSALGILAAQVERF